MILRARSTKLGASVLLEPQNGLCGAGAWAEGHKRVPQHAVGLEGQTTACSKGPGGLGRRQGRAMGCRWERSKHVPGGTLTGETLDVSSGYRTSRPQIQALKGLHKTVFSWLCLLLVKHTLPQVVSEGSRHL